MLTDSHMILDFLDGPVLDGPVNEPLFPVAGPKRHAALQIAALAAGLADKAVALFYERRLHEATSARWEARCRAQIAAVAAALEADKAVRVGPWWFDRMTHADIMVACALRFAQEASPGVVDLGPLPHLQAPCPICRPIVPGWRLAPA